jgi:hypothetical protein
MEHFPNLLLPCERLSIQPGKRKFSTAAPFSRFYCG